MANRIRGAIDSIQQRRRKQRQLTSQEEAIRQADASSNQSPHLNPFSDPSRDNYRTYPYDYYSGSDCKVFYGDIWVDDIVSIQFNVNQNKTPIYGYASQNFNAVAKGRVIVNGTLTIAFKETGYLNLIQRISETQKNNAYDVIKRKADITRAKAEHRLAEFDPSLTYIGDDSPPNSRINASTAPNGSPQLIRQEETIEEILLGKKAGSALVKNFNRDIKSISRNPESSTPLGDKQRDFEDFAELLEDSIWGDSNGRPYQYDNLLKRADEFDYNSNGGINTATGQGTNAEYDGVLNIMLTFGDINDFRAEHTLVVLNDIHFTDTSMVVSPDGTPIGETYSFFARDINRSISNELMQSINPIKLEVGVDDLQIAKLEDIDRIEKKLNQGATSAPWIVNMQARAGLNDFGWRSMSGEILEVYLSMDRGEPLVDRMIEAVEKGFNDSQFADYVETDKSQYIIDTWFTIDEKITMVLDQGIPNTRTYKVIAPVRTGFKSPVVYTREDLFKNVSDLPEPLDEVTEILGRRKQQLANLRAVLDEEQERLKREQTSLGTEDELAEYQKRRDKADKLLQERQDDRAATKLGRAIQDRRVERAIQKQEDALREYVDENLRSQEDRSLTRDARDRRADLSASAETYNEQQEAFKEDRQAYNASRSLLDETLEDQQKEQQQIANLKPKSQPKEQQPSIFEEAKNKVEIEKIDEARIQETNDIRKDVKTENPPTQTSPWYARKEDVYIYSQTAKEHADRSNFAREAYMTGAVQAIDIQGGKDKNAPINFSFGTSLEYFNEETGEGAFYANIPQGNTVRKTRIGFAHAAAVQYHPERGISITPADPTRDSNQDSINPLLHVQTRDKDVRFQEGLTRAFIGSGRSIYIASEDQFIEGEDIPIAAWPDQEANRRVVADKENQRQQGRRGLSIDDAMNIADL